MREATMPSGKILQVAPAPFADAKALYQALLREMKSVAIGTGTDTQSIFKDLFCVGFSSREIESALWPCMQRCLYNGLKIDVGTFEPVECRQDYMKVCMEVAKENVGPFGSALYAEFKLAMGILDAFQT